MIKTNNFYIFFTLFYAYFVLSLFESARGSFIPFFVSEFEVSNAAISAVISFSTFGNVIGYYFAGISNEKYNQKITLIIGVTVCGLVALTSPFLDNMFSLTVFYFAFNMGRSFLCLSVDSIIPTAAIGKEVLLINITHLMYGIGSFVGQRTYGTLLFEGVMWRTIYIGIGLLFILEILFAFFLKVPEAKFVESQTKLTKKELYKNPVIILLIACFTFCVATEGIMFIWFINYMSAVFNYSSLEASYYSSAFFIAFSCGRLIGGFVLQKFEVVKGLKFFMGVGIVCLSLGVFLGENGLVLLSVSGFFISVLFPTMIIVISKFFKSCSSLAISTVVTWSSFINIGITLMVGLLNDFMGVQLTFNLVVIFLALSLIFLHMAHTKYLKIQQ